MSHLNPEKDFPNFIRGLSIAADRDGVQHFSSSFGTIYKGGFALVRDFGPKVECNDHPLSETVVLIREHVPHTLHPVVVLENGTISISSESAGIMVYPADFARYSEQFQNNNMSRKYEVLHVTPFHAPEKRL